MWHWQAVGSEPKAEEYSSLAVEIEAEIERMLDLPAGGS